VLWTLDVHLKRRMNGVSICTTSTGSWFSESETHSQNTCHTASGSFSLFEKSAGALGAAGPRWDPFVNARASADLAKLSKDGLGARARHTSRAMCGVNPNLITQKAASLVRPLPLALHALGVAPPRAVRARLGVLLGGLSAIQLEKALLVAAAVEYHAEEVIGRGPVRAERLDDRVAPGGDVGVEVLIGERIGGKAPADGLGKKPRHSPCTRDELVELICIPIGEVRKLLAGLFGNACNTFMLDLRSR
jgi:hypothetical protein